MANRYANLVGSKKINEDFGNINIGFDRVQAEMDTKGTPADAQAKADAAKTAAIAAAAADLAAHKARGADEHPTAKGNAAGFMSAADKLKSDASTSATTPDTLMQRDTAGRAKVAAPAATDDIARKAETDAVQTNLDSHTGDTVKHVTQAEHDKLNGIAAGAEVNQNAFAVINDVEASSNSDTVIFVGGTGITVTTDPEGKRIVLTATGEATPGAHASSHITGGTDVIPDAVIGGSSGLMSGADAKFARQDGETKTGAQAKADAAKEAANEYTDQKVGEIVIDDASLTKKGIVQLSEATDSQDVDKAATPIAVKKAYDLALAAQAIINNRDGYGITSNSGNAYSVSATPAPTALVAGLRVTIKVNAENTGAVTINVNGFGPKSVLKSNGGAMTSGAFKVNSVYSLVYNGTAFILQGEGGSGNALPSDVVLGKTFTNDDGEAVGTRVSYASGDMIPYAKMGLTDMVPKTNILPPNTSGNTTVPMGLTQAKDGSGYYIVYLELTNVRLAKYDNFGKLIWRIGVGTSNTLSSLGIPITGTRDGGVCLYFYNTQWSDPSIVKYTSDGSLVRRYAYTTGSYIPMDIQIDSDGAIFVTSSNGGVARLAIDDSFSSTATTASDTWRWTQMSVNTDIVIYRDWIYFIAGSQNSPYFIRLTKGPNAPTTSQYSISIWSDEGLSGTGLVGNGVGGFYVSSTAGRIYCLSWTVVKSWDTQVSSGAASFVADIIFYNNFIYMFNKLNGLTTENSSSTNDLARLNSIKTLSFSGALQSGEFPVFIKHATQPQLDGRLSSGKMMQFTSDPPNNVILCLNSTTTLYANQMQIQP